MTSIPNNLTLIREDFQKAGSLTELKAAMGAATTDYVMVAGIRDIVDVSGVLDGDVHYLPTHVATRRAFRYSRPVLAYDPVLLAQFNYMGLPILHRSLIPLVPDTAVEPWHVALVRAQLQGASFSLVAGSHTIIEPWPRPELSGAYAHYHHSLDPAATMEAVPTVLVQEINQQPFYTLRDPRAESFRIFCRNCSNDFIGSLAASNVVVETLPEFDYNRIRDSNATYVAWFDGIEGANDDKVLSQLQVGLEFPGVVVISPRVVADLTLETYRLPANGIFSGLDPAAWMARTRDLGPTLPVAGYTNTQAILGKIS
jgi:hypothetical protein